MDCCGIKLDFEEIGGMDQKILRPLVECVIYSSFIKE